MSRTRIFSKAEIMDAAKAAAETGLTVRLCPNGEMIFTHETATSSPAQKQSALEAWKNTRKAHRHPSG